MQKIRNVLEWEDMSSKNPLMKLISSAIEREFHNEVSSGEVLETDIHTHTQRIVETRPDGFSDCSLQTGTSCDSDTYESSFIDDDSEAASAVEDDEWDPQHQATTVEPATTGDAVFENDESESESGESESGESDGEGDSGGSDSATATPDTPL